MTDKQKIKQEIEKRISQFEAKYPKDLGGYWNDEESAAYDCAEEYKRFLQFIDSFPEEHNENLEEASIKYSCANPSEHIDGMFDQTDIEWAFEAGAEWQKQQYEKLFSKDSWTYIEENYHNITEEEKLRLYDISIKSRLAGANAIKQQIMKDVVELHIIESFNPIETEDKKPHGFTSLCNNAEYPNFYPITGQTIKVIPIK